MVKEILNFLLEGGIPACIFAQKYHLSDASAEVFAEALLTIKVYHKILPTSIDFIHRDKSLQIAKPFDKVFGL